MTVVFRRRTPTAIHTNTACPTTDGDSARLPGVVTYASKFDLITPIVRQILFPSGLASTATTVLPVEFTCPESRTHGLRRLPGPALMSPTRGVRCTRPATSRHRRRAGEPGDPDRRPGDDRDHRSHRPVLEGGNAYAQQRETQNARRLRRPTRARPFSPSASPTRRSATRGQQRGHAHGATPTASRRGRRTTRTSTASTWTRPGRARRRRARRPSSATGRSRPAPRAWPSTARGRSTPSSAA